jgi:outer membrane lipoprotein-sorting protein
MTIILAVATVAITSGQATNIDGYLQTDLKDATIVARIVKGNQKELLKINKDFGQSYRFESSTIYFKEPFKMRAEAHVEETSVVYIINGTDLTIKIPNMKLPKQDLAHAPGRRQTLMDIGILTPSLMSGLLNAEFKRMDRETGDAVFDLTYKPEMNDATRYRVWIDKNKKYIAKREWFNQWTRQLATFYYSKPIEVSGVWLPTHLEVKNADNVVAGITSYESIKVNSGISDSLFISK